MNPAAAAKSVNSSMSREFTRAISDLVDYSSREYGEKFDESTYNKKLEKIKAEFGDEAINSDSVVLTIRSTSGIIRESIEFL